MTATQVEIAEQFRALSLIFHPDKQHDEQSRKIATERFQELSAAYEVLSDPFLREIYDLRGEEGLNMLKSQHYRSMPRNEIKRVLLQSPNLSSGGTERSVAGSAAFILDASPLFCHYMGSAHDTWTRRIFNRCEDLSLMGIKLERTFETSITDKTSVSAKCHLSRRGRTKRAAGQLVGTVRHQFSPRFASEVNVGFIPLFVEVFSKYEAKGTLILARVRQKLASAKYPTLTLTASRQLFFKRSEVAAIELDIAGVPKYSFMLHFPNIVLRSTAHDTYSPISSVSGLRNVISSSSIGFRFTSILPAFVVEQALNLTELALQLRLRLEWSFRLGLEWEFGGTWQAPQSDNKVLVTARSDIVSGISFTIDVVREGHIFSLPIILSPEPEPTIACFAFILPSTIALLGYHLVVKPRRRKQRLEDIRAARKEQSEYSGMYQDREAVVNLLASAAMKSKEAESSKGGLVITKATWGPLDEEDNAKDLVVDVTIPLQALVRKSQIYIPGDRIKSNVRGFGDPAPFARKVLSVWYTFQDQHHYTEIREDFPVVLPLAGEG